MPPRRRLLGAMAAFGAGLAVPRFARAEASDPAPRRIAVHHHFSRPAWLEQAQQRQPGPSPVMREWSTGRVLELMDKTGVATAIASLSPWGVAFADATQLPKLARVCNDFAAQMIRDH